MTRAFTANGALHAECQRCDWTTRAPNGLGNAARHHDATGHRVTVTIHRTITYGDPAAPLPGQDELFPTEEPTA